MTLHPVKKTKLAEGAAAEESLSAVESLKEMLEMAHAQEVETRYIGVIETLKLAISEKNSKVWMYGPKRTTDLIIGVVLKSFNMRSSPLKKRLHYEKDLVYLFDLSSAAPGGVRAILYKVLEATAERKDEEKEVGKFIFQIPRVTDINKLDKRIGSRMEGTKIWIKELQEKDYLRIFSRVIETLRERKNSAFDFENVNQGLSKFVHSSYLIDSTFEGMCVRFYKYMYRIEEPEVYSLLNPVHLIILMTSSIKRSNLSSVYEEFERRTAGLAHFKKIEKDTVHRRLTDLMELGLVARGFFMSDKSQLEMEVLKRDEIYLKVILERIKRLWK